MVGMSVMGMSVMLTRGGGGVGSRTILPLKLTLTIFFKNIREFHKKRHFPRIEYSD